MLKIRLKRVGRRNDPSFRVVVVESRRGPKSNDFIERVGFYNPKTKERELNGERISYWMGVGAQVSDTVYNMLVDAKIIEGKKKNVLPRKSPVEKEVETSDKKQETTEGEIAAPEALGDAGNDKAGDDAVDDTTAESSSSDGKPIKRESPRSDDQLGGKSENAPVGMEEGKSSKEKPVAEHETRENKEKSE